MNDFIETNSCAGGSIYGHGNCAIRVRFAPTPASTGVRTATITVTDNASPATQTLTPADYSLFHTCTSVTEGSSCIAVVFFKPAAVGSRPATLTFTDNANYVAGAKQVVTVTGTGD